MVTQSPMAMAAPERSQASMSTEQQRRFTKVGLVINASLTTEAAERAGDETHALLRSLAIERQRATNAERAAAAARREAEAERGKSARATQAARDAAARADRAEAEASRLRDDQIAREEALLAELGRRDAEYAAAKNEFARRVNDIVERRDPRIDEALTRYLDGDIGALDDLADYTEAIVAANRAGRDAAIASIERDGRRRDGDLLRSTAAIWLDAADKGEKTTRAVLAKWLDAARTDPDEFSQWQSIYSLADDLGEAAIRANAADQLWSRARTLDEHIQAAATCASQHIGKGRWCSGEWTRNQYQDEEIRLWREKVALDPYQPTGRIGLASALWRNAPDDLKDKSKREMMLAEAETLIGDLARDYPDSPLVAYRARLIAEASGRMRLDEGTEREKTRRVYTASLQQARNQMAARPESFLAQSGLVSELQSMSGIADADRDEAQSLALVNEAIMIAEAALAKDPENERRAAVLWHALTRAAMSARVYGAFERERDFYARTLDLSRRFDAGDSRYMLELTIPRLAGAELMLGNLERVRALYAEQLKMIEAGSTLDGTIEQPAQFELLSLAMNEARLLWIEQDYVAAEVAFASLRPQARSQPDPQSRFFSELIIDFNLLTMFIEQQRVKDAIALASDVRFRLDAMGREPALREPARFGRLTIDLLMVVIPGSGVGWADLVIPDPAKLDPENYRLNVDDADALLTRRAAMPDDIVGSGTVRDRIIGSLRPTARLSLEMMETGQPSAIRIGGFLSVLKLLALAGDPEVTWQLVADRYLHFHKLGWITDPSNVGDFEFAMARAAILRRRANADHLPTEVRR